MLVFRIQKGKYGSDISGFGSTLVSGRWHLAGTNPVLYTSSNISLAILECVVHLPPAVKPPDLAVLTIEIPDNSVIAIATDKLPVNWDKKGYFDNVQHWGTRWLEEQESLAIAVPSAASPDYNVLINPAHLNFRMVKVIDRKQVTLDDRLI